MSQVEIENKVQEEVRPTSPTSVSKVYTYQRPSKKQDKTTTYIVKRNYQIKSPGSLKIKANREKAIEIINKNIETVKEFSQRSRVNGLIKLIHENDSSLNISKTGAKSLLKEFNLMA